MTASLPVEEPDTPGLFPAPAHHCVAGREWYRVNDEITQYIDSVITIHGRCVDAFEVNRRTKTPPIAGIRPRTTRKKRYAPD